VAASMGCELVIHPSITERKRAWKVASRIHEPKPYLLRNKDIVRASEMLVAAPVSRTEQLRSGTWSAVRFARKLGRTLWVLLPDGGVLKE
jgi:hypothetical protein